MFDGLNEEITIVNRTTDESIITANIMPSCYRYGLMFSFSNRQTDTKKTLEKLSIRFANFWLYWLE